MLQLNHIKDGKQTFLRHALISVFDFRLLERLRMCECQKSTFNPCKDKALAGNPGEQTVSGCPRATEASSKNRQETICSYFASSTTASCDNTVH